MLTDRLARAGADVHIAGRDFSEMTVDSYLYCRSQLDKIQPSLAHADALVGTACCCALVERRISLVQHVHVADEPNLMALNDQIRIASAVIAVSQFVKRRLIRLGADPRKIHVIHNGTPVATGGACNDTADTDQGLTRTTARKGCGLPEDAPVILMPARFAANKRHDVAIDALAQLRIRLPNAHLVLVGQTFTRDRPLLQAVETRINKLGLHSRVRRLGFWPNIAVLYTSSDVLLLPSEGDPLPLTVLEGMAAGLPVVAARSGGTPGMIQHGSSGLLVDPGDTSGFADALVHVLTDNERRVSLITGGLARSRAEFALPRFVGRVQQLYERVLAGESSAAAD